MLDWTRSERAIAVKVFWREAVRMSNWEHELETLLSRLGVRWESLPPNEPGTDRADVDLAHAADVDGLIAADLENDDWETLEEDDLDQVSVVRREMQATVARVTRMVRSGRLDSAIKDDVLLVLRALCRSQPQPDEGESEEDAQLATAAAILHFCRIVLRLTHALAQQ
jgi:hypothetical protein